MVDFPSERLGCQYHGIRGNPLPTNSLCAPVSHLLAVARWQIHQMPRSRGDRISKMNPLRAATVMRADSSAPTGVMVNSEHRTKNLVVTTTLVSWQVPVTGRSPRRASKNLAVRMGGPKGG